MSKTLFVGRTPLFTLVALFVACAALGMADASAQADPARAMAPAAEMDDATLLHVFITSNRGEIVTSEPVVDEARSEEVRAYAEMMVAEHNAVIERATALGIAPRDNMVSMSMTMQAEGIARELEGMDDAAMLDMKYLEHQIVLHGHTLATLDHVLIPNADSPEFRALLEQTRPSVMQHHQRAMQLHHQMMTSGDAGHGDMNHDDMDAEDDTDRESGSSDG